MKFPKKNPSTVSAVLTFILVGKNSCQHAEIMNRKSLFPVHDIMMVLKVLPFIV